MVCSNIYKIVFFIFLVISILSTLSTSITYAENAAVSTKDTEAVKIRLGSSYYTITTKLGSPVREVVKSQFWGNKKSLYKINEGNYCIVEYALGRAKNILFLEQVNEEEAIEKLKGE